MQLSQLSSDKYYEVHLNDSCFYLEKDSFAQYFLRYLEEAVLRTIGEEFQAYDRDGSEIRLEQLTSLRKIIVLGCKSAFYDIVPYPKRHKFFYRVEDETFLIDAEQNGRFKEVMRVPVTEVRTKESKAKHIGPFNETLLFKRAQNIQIKSKGNEYSKMHVPLTRDEVAAHSSDKDGWIIFKKNVYNVTNFLKHHPGGSQVILDLLGEDVTRQVERNHAHINVERILEKEKVGWLKN